jgi:hypothetical protein
LDPPLEGRDVIPIGARRRGHLPTEGGLSVRVPVFIYATLNLKAAITACEGLALIALSVDRVRRASCQSHLIAALRTLIDVLCTERICVTVTFRRPALLLDEVAVPR